MYFKKIAFILVVFSLLMPSMVIAKTSNDMVNYQGMQGMMSSDIDNIDDTPCCDDSCKIDCMTSVSAVVLPDFDVSSSSIEKSVLLFSIAKDFSSIFPEAIIFPPISIS